MPALLLKYLPYLIAAALVAGGSGYVVHHWDSASYNVLQASFEKYKAEVATAQEASQKAATQALQDQMDEKLEDNRRNGQVIHELLQKSADADARHSADSAYIRRLLNGSSASTASGSGQVPATGDQPGTIGAGGESGVEQVANLCADTREEDQRNADRLDALLAELTPQLRRHQ